MTEELKNQTESAESSPTIRTEEERVNEALEKARQTVKPIVKVELEGEIIGDDLLNLRLRCREWH